MFNIKCNKNRTIANVISIEFTKENPKVESKFFNKQNNNYDLFNIYACLKNRKVIAGINGELRKDRFYIDEIWVHPDYRDIWIGKKMLIELKKVMAEKNVSICYYDHLNFLDGYFKKNSIEPAIKNTKKGKINDCA